MNFQKVKHYFVYLLYALGVLLLIKISLSDGDFKVFLEASKFVLRSKNPYHTWIFINEGNYAFFFNSPLWATLLIPFSFLPNVITNFIWLLLNVWFLFRIWNLLSNYLDFQNTLAKNQINQLLTLIILMSIRYILYNFEMIQMTIFLLWGSLESLELLKKDKSLYGGALLALIINIKILPIVLLPYLLYRKKMKGMVITLVFSLIYLLIPCFILGWKTNLFFLSEWWSVINPGNQEHLMEVDLGLHSLTALIPSLLTKTQGVLPYPRNIFNFNVVTTTYILNGVRCGLVAFTLFFLGWPPFKPVKSKIYEIREISYLFLIIPLIFPHQQKYAFFLDLPALCYITYFIIVNYNKSSRKVNTNLFYLILTLFILSFILMTLTTDSVIGRNLNLITQHYKTITYGAILLIFILILCSPNNLIKKIEVIKAEIQ